MKKGNTVITLVMFFGIIMAFCAFAIDFTIVLTQRAKLQSITEKSAIAAASNYAFLDNLTPNSDKVEEGARKTLDLFKDRRMPSVEISEIELKPNNKAVFVKTKALVPTYFLGVLGIGTIKIEAQSSAISETRWLDSSQPKVMSETRDIISQGGVLVNADLKQDTNILPPLSEAKSASFINEENTINADLIYGEPDEKPLSLGAGGYVTLRLPILLTNKKGNDLYIKEAGTNEGYFIFAGIDANPKKPYLDAENQGDGIKWVNISCTGTPETTGVNSGAYSVFVPSLFSWQTKFYGSGYFDLGASCSDGYEGDISAARYVKIIDDNEENGLSANNQPVWLLGESSNVTSGADIDAVGILNSVRLIKTSEFKKLG